MITEILLAVVLVLLVVLIVLFLWRGSVGSRAVQSGLSKALDDIGLGEKLGRIGKTAEEIQSSYRSFEDMLRSPTERGAYGEMALEAILLDQLPRDMFGMKQKVLDGKVPDAHIESTVGTICIDSKFPLDNYRKMMGATDAKEKELLKTRFLKDVEGHFEKVRVDYVCPEEGSAEFAFAFVPSETLYWFLVREAFDMLRTFIKKGVHAVSPLVLCQRIELVKAGVHARKLSEQALSVRNDINRIAKAFDAVDEAWRVFFATHLRNLGQKAKEIDSAYKKLKREFDKTTQLSSE